MKSAAEVVKASRENAGLSMRALAVRAEVAYTTVQRIEQGSMDPTVGMLSKLLAAMGEELALESKAVDIPEIANLTDAWHTDKTGQQWPDFTRLRAFLDYLSWYPELKGAATLRAPKDSGSELMNNLLAAMAEKICDDAGISRPSWSKKVPPLKREWAAPMTPKMREAALLSAASQFLKRGIVVSSNSLWRETERAHVS
jgi:transcriptional regulator with XRE-family HTH domain